MGNNHIRRLTPISRICLDISVPGENIRVGLYEREGDYPTKLLLDAGIIDTGATGLKKIVCDISVDLGNLPFAGIRTLDGKISIFPTKYFLHNSYWGELWVVLPTIGE